MRRPTEVIVGKLSEELFDGIIRLLKCNIIIFIYLPVSCEDSW